MRDRREYSRVNKKIECTVYNNGKEYNGTIENISNNGVGLTINCKLDDIVEDEIIEILFSDNLNWNQESYYLCIVTVMVHKLEIDSDKVFIGLKTRNNAENEKRFQKYVDDLKVEEMFNTI